MLRLELRDGSGTWALKEFLEKLGFFKKRPELLNGGKYRVSSNVDLSLLDLFLTHVYGQQGTEVVTRDNAEKLKALSKEFGFTGLDAEIDRVLATHGVTGRCEVLQMRSRIDTLEVIVERLRRQVLDLERLLPQQIADLNEKVDDVLSRFEHQSEETEQSLRRQMEDIDRKVDKVANTCRRQNKQTKQTLRKEIAAVDVTEDVQRLGGEIRKMAMATDLAALSEQVARLKQSDTKTQPQISPQPEHGQEFRDSAGELQGIIAYLTRRARGNCHLRRVIEVTSSSVYDRDTVPENAVDFTTSKFFASCDKPGSWICYDFKDMRVKPSSYTIKTYPYGAGCAHLKSWVLEGSTDGKSWEVLDSRNTHDLNYQNASTTCEITAAYHQGFRLIRLRQKGQNHLGTDTLIVAAFELFGTLFTD